MTVRRQWKIFTVELALMVTGSGRVAEVWAGQPAGLEN